MYRHKYAVLGTVAAVAFTVACSNAANPVSPNAAVAGSGAAGPNGETLKIAAPGTTSPSGGATAAFPVTLTVANVSGQYSSFPVTYRWEVRNAINTTVATGTQAAGSGETTSIVIGGSMPFDAALTWRVRAEYQGAAGPWSGTASFRSPAGSFIKGAEMLDVLADGKTVGQAVGPVTFVPGVGARMEDGSAYIAYEMPTNIQSGEFSFVATNVDEGNPGDKSKVMSIGEVCHVDVTDNDYRQTLELRGSIYPQPGTISYRIITGDAREEFHRINDSVRVQLSWSRTQTYFFKMHWNSLTDRAGYEIREGGPTGGIMDAQTVDMAGFPYRPTPMCLYVGAPPTRAGVINQTHPGQTVRNAWASVNPRPTFPSIISMGGK